MKVKLGILTLLTVGLVLSFATMSYATAPTLSIVAANNQAYNVAAGDSFVVAAFVATATATTDNIAKVSLTNTGTHSVSDNVAMVSIYEDKNANGIWDSEDAFLGRVATPGSAGADILGAGPVLVDVTQVNFTAVTEQKSFLVVVTLAKKAATATVFDGETINFNVDVEDAAAVASPAPLTTFNADTIAVVASHLQWRLTTGANYNLNMKALSGTEILAVTGDDQPILWAVDDYGNLDKDFTEGVILKAEDMRTGADVTAGLTATGENGDMKVVGTATPMLAGVINNDVAAGGPTNYIRSIKFDHQGYSQKRDGITLVAQSVGKKIEGSVTVYVPALQVTSTNYTLQLTDSVSGTQTFTVATGYYGPAGLAAAAQTAIRTGTGSFTTYTVTANANGTFTIATGGANTVDIVEGVSTIEEEMGFTADGGAAASLTSNSDWQTENAGLDVWPAIGSVTVAQTRGIEVYDVDHNGYIDHMTIVFDVPVQMTTALLPDHFAVGSGYTVNEVVYVNSGGTIVNCFDAGGVGVRNVGQYGITVKLTEKTVYDTNVKPDLYYKTQGAYLSDRTGTPGTTIPTFSSGAAVEVDRARPVMISARTTDSGVGTGTANNGVIDGVIFEFSEPVQNYSAGGDSTGHSFYFDPAEALVFTGNGTLVGSTLTVPVGETSTNTGKTPEVWYNKNLKSRITDFATSATAAPSPNIMFPTKTDNAILSSFTVEDGAPMVVTRVETKDNDADGYIDRVEVTFSENVQTHGSGAGVEFYSSVSAFASSDLSNGIYVVSGASLLANKITFTIYESGESIPGNPPVPGTFVKVADTEALPSFRYNRTLGNIRDANGIELNEYGPAALSHPETVDGAAPAIVQVITGDAYTDTARVGDSGFEAVGANGRIDHVKIIFSEQVKTEAGAQNGGTALDNAVAQFTITHPDVAGGRTKITTAEAIGAPVWEDKDASGNTSSELTIAFQEVSKATVGLVNGGDTGKFPSVAFAQSGTINYRIKDLAPVANYLQNKTVNTGDPEAQDGAKPFLVMDIGKNWGAQAFAGITTYDKNEPVTGGRHNTPALATDADDTGNGDGYLDGYKLMFTETVSVAGTVTGAKLKYFTMDSDLSGALKFEHADARLVSDPVALTQANANTWYLLGKVDESKSDPNTHLTPALSYTYNSDCEIKDTAAVPNKLATFEEKPSYDGAPPVIVGVYGGDTLRDLDFTFSEPVYAHNAEGANVSFNAVTIQSSSLFGYQNLSTGAGSSGFTTAAVTQISERKVRTKLNYDLQVADIEADLVWVRTAGVYDNANAADKDLADNAALNSTSGSNIKINIMDDVIAPWITEIATIDWNGNGKVDHLRFTFSENIDDSTLNGYLGRNTMSDDVSANWVVSGYSGTARWNLFEGAGSAADKNAAYLAAIAAGKPVFNDNGDDDAVLYLELEEDLVPMNALNGKGSGNFLPTVTFSNITLGDFRPNLLYTIADTSKDPDSVGGTVKDKVRPTIVEAVWNDTSAAGSAKTAATGGYVTLYFSELVKHADKPVYYEYFTTSLANTNLWGYTWLDDATLELAIKSDKAFSKSASETIQVVAGWAEFKDWKDNVGLVNGQNLADMSVDAYYNSALHEVKSPMGTAPAPAKANTVGGVSITNTAYIYQHKFSDTSPHAGESVKIEWRYRTAAEAMFDTVELYESFNDGETWNIVPGLTAPAADQVIYWTAKMGVNAVKVQAVGSAAWNFTQSVMVYYDGDSVGSSIGAPADLAIMDVPGDNGGFVTAQFTVSSDHLTAVNSYQFYRQIALDEADPNNMTWVLWAAVEAGAPDDMNKQSVIVPTIWNGASSWAVRASTGSVISGATVAAKAAGEAVATLLYGGAEKAASGTDVLSAMSNIATGAAIDNIAPTAMADYSLASAGNGIEFSWVAPEDHGVVSSYVFRGSTQYIYGVEGYEVYRTVRGQDDFTLVGTAAPGSVTFIDPVQAGATVYSYYIKAVDGNPDHASMTPVRSGISTSALKGDFNGDASINASDFSIFAANYNTVAGGNEANYVWAYDLNTDGTINAADFSIFAAAYGSTLQSSKAAVAEMPTSDIPFGISATIDETTSTYFVNVNIGQAETLKGFEFFMGYNTEAFEFIPNSVNGLVGLNMTTEIEDGVIRVSDWFVGQEFNGTVSLGFRSTGLNRTSTFEILNAVIDVDGLSHATNVAEFEAKALPTVYALSQNYPNPFNPTTTIDYSMPKSGNVELVIYNASGQKVRSLVSGAQDAGFYKVVWDGRNDYGESVASGVYLYKLVAGSFSRTAKMNLVK